MLSVVNVPKQKKRVYFGMEVVQELFGIVKNNKRRKSKQIWSLANYKSILLKQFQQICNFGNILLNVGLNI